MATALPTPSIPVGNTLVAPSQLGNGLQASQIPTPTTQTPQPYNSGNGAQMNANGTPVQAPFGAALSANGLYYLNGQAYSSAPPTTAPVEPTALTSSSIDDLNQNNQASLAAKSSTPTGQSLGQEGFVRNADQSFAEAPAGATTVTDPSTGNQYWTYNGMSYALGNSAGQVSSDPTVQSLYNQFTSLKGQVDSTAASNIAAIQQQYTQLIQQQSQANAGNQAGTYSLLARGGSLQTASSGGILNAQVSYGLQQIGDLQNKENQAVIAAQQAQQTQDYQLLDEQLKIASDANTQKQAAAQKISDAIMTATQQARKDSAITSVVQSGVTDPGKILAQLQAQGNDTVSLKDIDDTISALNPDQATIIDFMKSAAANGAPSDVLKAMGNATSTADALTAGYGYFQDPTSLGGQYQSYVKDANSKGLTPMTPADFLSKQKATDAYNSAYASESAKNQFDDSSTNQDKLEQEGRAVIEKELTNRSGGLGVQDAKVNQAIHLKALFDQYATTITVPNTAQESDGTTIKPGGTHTETVYNIPRSQYTELAMGLASLISPSNTVAEGTINKITQATAQGDLNAAITYATGDPQNGTTQEVLQNLKDSVDRQGTVAQQERQTYIDNLSTLLPTDLDADRRASLLSGSQLNMYTTSKDQVDGFVKTNPDEAETIAKLYEIPGVTDEDVWDYINSPQFSASSTDTVSSQ